LYALAFSFSERFAEKFVGDLSPDEAVFFQLDGAPLVIRFCDSGNILAATSDAQELRKKTDIATQS